MNEIDKMLDSYAKWIREEITCTKIGEYSLITTPYLDHMNDYLQIYVKLNQDGSIDITDDGYVINNLEMCGINISRSPSHKKRLKQIAASFGVTIEGDAIVSKATIKDFPQKKHLFIQAMLKIDDMVILSQNSNTVNFFNEDVKEIFNENNIYYSEGLSLVGHSGNVYPYDFIFQRSKTNPERFCKTINHLTKTTQQSAIFSWLDTKDVRNDGTVFIVLINDSNSAKDNIIKGFENYNITPVKFSNLKKNISLFAA